MSGAQRSVSGAFGTGLSASTIRETSHRPMRTAMDTTRTIRANVIADLVLSRLDADVAADLGLAGQDVAIALVGFGQGILHRHAHTARHQLDAARTAGARTAGVVDEHAGFVGRIEDRRSNRDRRGEVRGVERHLAGQGGRCGHARRGIAFDGAESLSLDLTFRHPKPGERGPDRVHHRRRAANMRPPPGYVRHRGRQQRRIDVADGAGPWLVTRAAHGHRDAETGIARLKLRELIAADEVARRAKAENEVDLAWPADIGEIARNAHHRRDAYAATDQDDAVRLFAAEAKSPVGRLDLDLVANLEIIVQPA